MRWGRSDITDNMRSTDHHRRRPLKNKNNCLSLFIRTVEIDKLLGSRIEIKRKEYTVERF